MNDDVGIDIKSLEEFMLNYLNVNGATKNDVLIESSINWMTNGTWRDVLVALNKLIKEGKIQVLRYKLPNDYGPGKSIYFPKETILIHRGIDLN